jgi:hypothetical protein
MNQVNYAAMSDKELRRYFLQNREDREAMQAYFSRVESRPHRIVATLDDPDFDAKVQASIQRQIREADHQSGTEG